ncbi:AIM24 family protein [Paenibacillus validus]|uniref:AIM24 family protein n=1 Tax=Paenibacillus validus TaxID=44253 RepID=UPI003D2D0326
MPMDLSELGNKIICQKDAFLCAAKGVSVGIDFQRKLGDGLLRRRRLYHAEDRSDGLAFVHAGGAICERVLRPGELIRVDTGCLVAMTQEVDYDIEFVKGVKTALFGGEGCSSQRCADRDGCGFNRCRSAVWPTAS